MAPKILFLLISLLSTSLFAQNSGFYCQATNTSLSLVASSTKVIVMLPNERQRMFRIDLSSQMHNDNLIMRLENSNEDFALILNIQEQNLTRIASAKSMHPKSISRPGLEIENEDSTDLLHNFMQPRNIRATMFLDEQKINLLCDVEDYLVI